LILSLDKSYFKNVNPRFALISPTTNITLTQNQTQNFKIRYTPDPSELYNIRDTFMLVHNDTIGSGKKANPFPIAIQIDSVIYTKLTCISSTDFGVIQIGKPKTSTIIYRNDGNVNLKVTDFQLTSSTFTLVNPIPIKPTILAPGQTITFNVKFDPTDETISKTDFNVDYSAEKYACGDNIKVVIQGKGSKGALSYPTEIDFGFMNWCKVGVDTVIILNTSTNPSDVIRIINAPTLSGANKNDFSIITDPTKQYPLTLSMTNGIQYYIVFNPAGKTPGKYTASFDFETDLSGNETISIPITAEVAEFDVQSTPTKLEFGNVYVGFDSPKINLSLQNNGVLREHITSEKCPSEMTLSRITGSDYLAPNGGSNTYTAGLKLKNGGNYTGNVTFTFDEPCNDVITVPITANGLLSDITVIDTLDFGIHPPCAVKILRDVTFENHSPAPYVIIQGSEQLIDNTDGFFIFVASGLSKTAGVNDTIYTSGQISAGQFNFDAREGFTGTVYAKYLVKVYQNGVYKDVYVVLKATIDPGSYKINNNPTVFDPTIINQKSQKTVEILNTGRWNMKILSLSVPSQPEFTILPNTVVGTTLGTNQKTSFVIEFYPKVIGPYSAIINITYQMDSCTYNKDIQLNAVGGRSRTLILRLPDTLIVDPNIDTYSIPVYAKLKAGDDPISNYSIDTIQISFARSLFYFRDLSKGVNHNIMEFNNDDRIISFSVNNLNLTSTEQKITDLIGATMLGTKPSTDIVFTKVVLPNDGEITDIEKHNGYLEVKICDHGGDRLLINTGAKPDVFLVPNPATNNVNITANIIEKGDYTLEIYDLLGNKVLIQKWNKPAGGFEAKTINFDLSSFSNGVYIIRLTAPSQIINKTLNITK